MNLSHQQHSVLRFLTEDIQAKSRWCYENTHWRSIIKTLLTDGTAAMVWYRLMQWSRRWRLTPLELLFNRLNVTCCNCVIGRGTEFGPGLVFIHSTGIVINGQVRGGAHVYLEHQVTIGAHQRANPILGDRVFIGAGAKIIGEVTIGNDVNIGANAVVLDDVPNGATAVGIPARVVRVRSTSPTES